MRNSITSCIKSKLMVPILLVIALLFPVTSTEAQQGGSGAQRAHSTQNANSKQAAQGKSGKRRRVKGTRIDRAELPAAVIKTFSTDARLSRLVSITGNSIAAVKGYMLVKLDKTGVVIVTNDSGGSSGATVQMESTSDLKYIIDRNRVYLVTEVRVCWCGDGASPDSCQFGRSESGSIDTTRCAGQSCCKLDCVQIDQEGRAGDCGRTTLVGP